MNQAPTTHKVGLMNQAPTIKQLSFFDFRFFLCYKFLTRK